MNPDDYIPLEGRLRGPLFSTRLYIGRNHLLKATVVGVHENYRRYAWEDIQAFTLEKTPWGIVINVVCSVLLFCLGMSILGWQPGLPRLLIFHVPLAVLCMSILFVNYRRGPTCRVRIHTAVSDEWLGSLHRVDVAKRELEKLRTLILARQAPAAVDGAEAGTDGTGAAEAVAAVPVKVVEPLSTLKRNPKPPDPGGWHRGAAWLLAGNLACDLAYLMSPSLRSGWTALYAMVLLPSLVAAMGALISQSRKTSNGWLKSFGWANFGYQFLRVLALFGTLLIAAVRHFEKLAGKTLESGAGFDAHEFFQPLLVVESAVVACLLVFGALVMARYRPPQAPIPDPGA